MTWRTRLDWKLELHTHCCISIILQILEENYQNNEIVKQGTSWSTLGWLQRYRQSSPIYWKMVTSYFLQSLQKLEAENFFFKMQVAPIAWYNMVNKYCDDTMTSQCSALLNMTKAFDLSGRCNIQCKYNIEIRTCKVYICKLKMKPTVKEHHVQEVDVWQWKTAGQ